MQKTSNSFHRSELEKFLKQIGLRYFSNNKPVISQEQILFIKKCIREDLGVAANLNLKIRWYETGNAFSTASDRYGNSVFEIHLGLKNNIFQVGFHRRAYKFMGLYHNKKLVNEAALKNLI